MTISPVAMGDDTFVFSPLDGIGDDKIVDFGGVGAGFSVDDTLDQADVIDLTAFKINARILDDILEDHTSTRGESVILDLTGIGGGLISLQSNSETSADALLTVLQDSVSPTDSGDFFMI